MKLISAAKKFAPIRSLAIAITLAIYVQLALGATMRHQHRDLSILDFPTANGVWIPDTSANALAKINAWRDARALIGRGRFPNLAANDTSFGRATDRNRCNCIFFACLERRAPGSRAREIVHLVDRISSRSVDARRMDDLEQ